MTSTKTAGRRKEILRKLLATGNLRPYQIDAYKVIDRYISEYPNINAKSGTAALIHMATGTGKTGVITTVSHFYKKTDYVLILSPRICLRDQLAKELKGRFFDSIRNGKFSKESNVYATDTLKRVCNIKYKLTTDHKNANTAIIYVMTIQKFVSIANNGNSNAKKDYKWLKDNIKLLIIDEGHYEPAKKWSKPIRSFKKPTILFTATPFRNDYNLLNINNNHIYTYTFTQARDDGIVREVKIHTIDLSGTSEENADKLIDNVLLFYKSHYTRKDINKNPRVIIHCKSAERIKEIGSALKRRKKPFLMIHENEKKFSNEDNYQRTVPYLQDKKSETIFFVHQYKLLEGIDDNRFSLLVLCDKLYDGRHFVQQVGRIVRDPKSRKTAHVLDYSGGYHEELWKGFLEYEKYIREKKYLIKSWEAPETFNKKYKNQENEYVMTYLDRRFRSSIGDLSDINPSQDLLFPLITSISKTTDGFNFNKLCKLILQEYKQQDIEFKEGKGSFSECDFQVIISITSHNSKFLRTKYFLEPRLDIKILVHNKDYLCYFDSSCKILQEAKKYTEKISPDTFKKLFKRGSKLTIVDLKNSNLSSTCIRSRKVFAQDIANTPTMIDDHMFVCATAKGYIDDDDTKNSRYINFRKNSISDALPNKSFKEYINWLKSIGDVLRKETTASDEFKRFASPTTIPENINPINILLELDEIKMVGNEDIVESDCSDIKDGDFSIAINNRKYNAQINFNKNDKKYVIISEELEKEIFIRKDEDKINIIAYLNKNQKFCLITEDGTIYYSENFYNPTLEFGKNYDDSFGLLDILEPYRCLENIKSENGHTTNNNQWDNNSLFRIIDDLGKGKTYERRMDKLFGDPDILICTDQQTEIADFILSDNNRVVFIHAKRSCKSRPYGASALHIVCSQAVKNIKYLSRFEDSQPPNISIWDEKWNKKIERIRRSPNGETGEQLWEEIRKRIRRQSYNVEVWLFLGRILSKKALKEMLYKDDSNPNAIQTGYLLFSTMNTIASTGAKLKVMCYP